MVKVPWEESRVPWEDEWKHSRLHNCVISYGCHGEDVRYYNMGCDYNNHPYELAATAEEKNWNKL